MLKFEPKSKMVEGREATNVDGRRLVVGVSTQWCTDEVLWNGVPETCIMLTTSVAPTIYIKA